MINKIVSLLKYSIIFGLALVSIIACENEFENIDTAILTNDAFNAEKYELDVVAYNVDVKKSRVDNLPIRNLGIYHSDNFGTLNASLISQLSLPSKTDFGLNPVIDAVVLEIPYFYSADGETTRTVDGKEIKIPKYKLDSVFGNANEEYNLKVYRLATFLNTLNPENPTKAKIYYSNENYNVSDLLYEGNFKPSAADTLLEINRPLLNTKTKVKTTADNNDKGLPSLKVLLDKDFFTNMFINGGATASDLASFNNFSNFFRGIKIQPQLSDNKGALITLPARNAKISIYYTNEVLTDEKDKDLNGDGDKDDKQVPVLTEQTSTLTFSGVTTSAYNRNYNGSEVLPFITSPNKTDGSDYLFIQGSQGSNAEIELMSKDKLSELRSENLLVNGAILDFYIDNPDKETIYPSKLYLYKSEEGSTIKDLISEARVNGIGGNLIRNSKGLPERYSFTITDYMSDVLKSEKYEPLSKLTLKTYHTTDNPVNVIDTIVKDFSWNVRPVKLIGNKTNNANKDKKLKLTLYYSKEK